MPETPVPSAATEASLETRVATAIWDACEDGLTTGILGDAECARGVIALVRAEVAREIRALIGDYDNGYTDDHPPISPVLVVWHIAETIAGES